MTGTFLQRFLPDEEATVRLSQDLAQALRPGDVLLLHGDLGAGKTTLARGLIRAIAGDDQLEVPSPTFTLVQNYDSRIPIRHFDLYRLHSADELDELGFEEAIETGAALVEWPERAQDRMPASAVTVQLTHQGDGRIAEIIGKGPAFERIARSLAIRAFLAKAGWGGSRRAPFAGDASARIYETVTLPGQPVRILMDSPRLMLGPPVRDGKPYAEIAHSAQTVAAFVGVGTALKKGGVTVPSIYAADLEQGFLLIEHLGNGAFLDPVGKPISARYEEAARLLAAIHVQKWPDAMETGYGVVHYLPPFDRAAMMIETELLVDWYVPYANGAPASDKLRAEFERLWNAAFDRIADCETSILLRDYHSPNIVWRDDRVGHDRLGVLDFQDAMRGPTAYDLASLAMDARVNVSPEIERAAFEAYCNARAEDTTFNRDAFDLAFATMAAQRNSKILGIFVRLDRRDGKPHYLKLLPRIRDYLARALAHPGLAELRNLYMKHGFIESAKA